MPSTVLSGQWRPSPRRHQSQEPHARLISPTTRRPSSGDPSGPSTTPTNSWPGIPANPWYPRRSSRSVLQIPERVTRMSASPGRATGVGTSRTRARPPRKTRACTSPCYRGRDAARLLGFRHVDPVSELFRGALGHRPVLPGLRLADQLDLASFELLCDALRFLSPVAGGDRNLGVSDRSGRDASGSRAPRNGARLSEKRRGRPLVESRLP